MNWSKYYASRVNSKTYDAHFIAKYGTLIKYVRSHIKRNTSTLIIEEGCGIGSVSRQLLNYFPHNPYMLMDMDKEMLSLSKENLNKFKNANLTFVQKNILHSLDIIYPHDKIVITHGVLEHFSDEQIKSITNSYSEKGFVQFHYVPIDGYKTPSFGDERLLPLDHWLKLLKVDLYTLINKQDLYFKITPNK